MRLLIKCQFDNAPQTLIKENATEGDARVLRAAMNGDPEAMFGVVCRITPDGPDRERLILARCIRSVTEQYPTPSDEV
jgi:hypothetical protein